MSDADIFKAKIYNHLNSEEKNKFIEEWKELDENAQYAGETIQSLFYYYMFYLRAKSEDDKSTTPGIRKYFSDNKYARLFAPELLADKSKYHADWNLDNITERGVKVCEDVLSTVDEWNAEYMGMTAENTPTPEDLAAIEKYKLKGWI